VLRGHEPPNWAEKATSTRDRQDPPARPHGEREAQRRPLPPDPPRDPIELAGERVVGLGRPLEDRPDGLVLRVGRLPLRPAGLRSQRRRGVGKFLGGELQAGVGHAADCSAAGAATSKGGAKGLYAAYRLRPHPWGGLHGFKYSVVAVGAGGGSGASSVSSARSKLRLDVGASLL
jgi:hypothetical protein